jgi:cellulose synthase/poly-beta-1,6-N-acetylglucosamine synthase-like glycosyltransferase
MEEDDEETLAAARAAHPPEMIRFVIIPEGAPKTKPRACNVGLFFARGEFLVIYDAEDRPEPSQLREAVAGFRATGPETICLQARLNYFNARENLLTRMFTLEYSYWFDYMLPGLDKLRLPLPLGGTSNHFRTDPLRRLSGWDAWNVTEDADLGLRAGAEGYRVGVIDSTTYEEACSRLRPWIRQRTRWIKGYMQTAVVHTRNPWKFGRRCGTRGLVTLALLVAGTPLVFMAAPVMWLLSLAWLGVSLLQFGTADVLPGEIEIVGLVNLVLGNGLIVALHALAVGRRKLWWLLPFALVAPFYWMLHSFASWRAAIQLLHNPFYWEKTPHGLGESAPEAQLPVTVAEPAA